MLWVSICGHKYTPIYEACSLLESRAAFSSSHLRFPAEEVYRIGVQKSSPEWSLDINQSTHGFTFSQGICCWYFKHLSLTSALNIRFDDGGIRRRQIPFRAFVIKGYVVDFSRVAMERIHGSEIMQHMSNSMEHIHDSSWLILRPGFLAKILLEAVCIAV